MTPKSHSVSACCGQKTHVIDSRVGASYGLRRRRECLVCGRRFTTLEIFAPEDHDHTKLAGDMALLTRLSGTDLATVRQLLERLHEDVVKAQVAEPPPAPKPPKKRLPKGIGQLKLKAYNWFKGREPRLSPSFYNIHELRTRLTWLSEGSLNYHLTKFEGEWTHGGCPKEKALFEEFMASDPPLRKR